MNERSLKHLYDALDAARSVVRFVEGRSFEDFCSDELLSAAIERKLEIIGEALIRIRNHRPEDLGGIGEWPAIIGFRNVLAHGYDRVDEAVVWGIVSDHVPRLIEQLSAIDEIQGEASLLTPDPPRVSAP